MVPLLLKVLGPSINISTYSQITSVSYSALHFPLIDYAGIHLLFHFIPFCSNLLLPKAKVSVLIVRSINRHYHV